MAKAKKDENLTLQQTLAAALDDFAGLTSPADFNTLIGRKAPKNAGQADHQRKLHRVVDERLSQFNSATSAFFALCDSLRADAHQAEKAVKLSRRQCRLAVLNSSDKEFVRAIRKRGNSKCDGLWADIGSDCSLTRDELVEAARD